MPRMPRAEDTFLPALHATPIEQDVTGGRGKGRTASGPAPTFGCREANASDRTYASTRAAWSRS